MRIIELRISDFGLRISYCLVLFGALAFSTLGQIPEPGPAKSVKVPAIKETKLKNGLTVAVVEKHSSPIVTVLLLVKAGAGFEGIEKAGLANLTADMLTKGTKTRSAEQIAEETEFLGTSINTGAGWNSSSVSMTVTTDKLDQAMAIMSDVIRNPSFKQEELDLLKSQTLDELKANLTQPAALASYTASVYSFGEHPAGGTPASIAAISRKDLADFHTEAFAPGGAVLIFAGDISQAAATSLSTSLFGTWRNPRPRKEIVQGLLEAPNSPPQQVKSLPSRILVVDLAGSGQASVTYATPTTEGRRSVYDVPGSGKVNPMYYDAIVLNSLLGGGYSSRLNQEIRIKRGLSYGAGSSFGWRESESIFSTRTQTKNQSAAEVAELVLGEIRRLASEPISDTDLGPRKSVLVGGFGRNIETTAGLAGALADLYTFNIPSGELNRYTTNVTGVSEAKIRQLAKDQLLRGDIIIVGDYSIFKDDLAKRFPEMKVEVIKASELDITKPNLKK